MSKSTPYRYGYIYICIRLISVCCGQFVSRCMIRHLCSFSYMAIMRNDKEKCAFCILPNKNPPFLAGFLHHFYSIFFYAHIFYSGIFSIIFYFLVIACFRLLSAFTISNRLCSSKPSCKSLPHMSA